MRIELRATPGWVKVVVPGMIMGALFTVFATGAVLKLAQLSDGVVLGGTAFALIVAMTGLVVGSTWIRGQRPVRYVLTLQPDRLTLTDAAGQLLASAEDGSLTLLRAVASDYVGQRFVFRPALLVRAHGQPFGSVALVGPAIDRASLPTIDPNLASERVTDRSLFSALQARAAT